MTIEAIKAAVEKMSNSDLTRDEKDLIDKLVAVAEAAKAAMENSGLSLDGTTHLWKTDADAIDAALKALTA